MGGNYSIDSPLGVLHASMHMCSSCVKNSPKDLGVVAACAQVIYGSVRGSTSTEPPPGLFIPRKVLVIFSQYNSPLTAVRVRAVAAVSYGLVRGNSSTESPSSGDSAPPRGFPFFRLGVFLPHSQLI